MRVTAPELFLRRVPTTRDNVPIARMKEGQVVHVLGEAEPPWLRLRTALGGSDAIGFASSRFLEPADAAAPDTDDAALLVPSAPVSGGSPPAVHFRENDVESRRASAAKRAQPLGEADRPGRDIGADAATRAAQLSTILDWLAAERSARYQRTDVTFCNVYAADYCYLARAYLPRVWWNGTALRSIGAGAVPPAQYDTTVREMRADDLLAWLIEFGAAFGWRRVFDGSALQSAANDGGIGVICADRAAPGPGHISIVVPETADAQAQRDADGHVVSPLQSQAGAENFRRRTTRDWWNDDIYRDRVFFVHG